MTEQTLYQYLRDLEEKIKKLDIEVRRALGYTKIIDKIRLMIEREDENRYILQMCIVMDLGDVDEIYLSKINAVEEIIKRELCIDNVTLKLEFQTNIVNEEVFGECEIYKKIILIVDIVEIILLPK